MRYMMAHWPGWASPSALQAGDLIQDEIALIVFVVGLVDGDLGAAAAVGEEVLGRAVAVAADHGIGRIEDGLGGAVILFEQDDLGVGEVIAEALDVAEIGAAPAVDGLIFVAHDKNIAMPARQQLHQFILGRVGVLKFIHQDVFEALLVVLADVGMIAQHEDGLHQQVVEIKGAADVPASPDSARKHGRRSRRCRFAMGIVFGRQQLVFGVGNGAVDGAGLVAFLVQYSGRRSACLTTCSWSSLSKMT